MSCLAEIRWLLYNVSQGSSKRQHDTYLDRERVKMWTLVTVEPTGDPGREGVQSKGFLLTSLLLLAEGNQSLVVQAPNQLIS